MLPLLLTAALAQDAERDGVIDALTLRFDSRYDNIDGGRERERLQNSALVAFRVDTVAGVDLAGMASTGDDFTSRWSTWRDLRGGEPERMALSLRQLYVQRWFGAVRAQAGSLSPVKGAVSTSGLEDLGWIDGVRLEGHHPSGVTVEGVAGSLTDIEEPDLFLRRRALDYGEVELDVALPSGFEVQSAYHQLGGLPYLKAELGWRHEDPLGTIAALRWEAGLQLADARPLVLVQARVDPAGLLPIDERLRDWVALRGMVRRVDPDYGPFGALSEDFYQFGTELHARLDGDLEPNDRLGYSVRYITGLSGELLPRLDIALTARLRL